MKSYHLIFCVGKNELINYLTYELAQAAKQLQIDYYIMDVLNPASINCPEYDSFIRQENCIALFFNQLGSLITGNNGQNLWAEHNIPIYTFLQDHPRYFYDALHEPLPNMHVITQDRRHFTFIKKYYSSISHVYFMPNGGSMETTLTTVGKPVNYDDLLPYDSRTIDVLYMGSCQSYEDLPSVSYLQKDGLSYYDYCISSLVSNPDLTTEDVIDSYFEDGNESCFEHQRLELHIKTAHAIEWYIRRKTKQQIITDLDRAGIRVDIYGSNWEPDSGSFSDNIRIHPRVSCEDCIRLIGQAKISLNINPWFKDGCTDRVFNNMINGAVSVSDRTPYLEERFTDGKDIILYSLNQTAQLADDILWLLSHPKSSASIAREGFHATVFSDTWLHRLKEIMKLIEAEQVSSTPY